MIKEFFYHTAQAAYKMQVKIPGFNYEESAGGASNLANYLRAIFSFLIWGTIILAMMMITIGGFNYITSAANASRSSEGKDRIKWAIYGLILALSSYLILNFINPELVSPKLPGMDSLKSEDQIITINKILGLGGGAANQAEGMSCLDNNDCEYDLICQLSKTEYHCPTSRDSFDSKEACEQKDNCKLPPGTSCKEVLYKVCKKPDIRDQIRYRQTCRDTDAPQGNCYDSRLVCRPSNESQLEKKYCLEPSIDLCQEDNDCQADVPVCDASDKICKTTEGETKESSAKNSGSNPFAISSPQRIDQNIIAVYAPYVYAWKEKACAKISPKWKKISNKSSKYFLDLPTIEDRESIDCPDRNNKCTVYRWAKKQTIPNLNGEVVTDPDTGEILYEEASCDGLSGRWEKTDSQYCKAIIDTETEDGVCCKNKNEIFSCYKSQEIKDWTRVGNADKNLKCRKVLKNYYSRIKEILGYTPGDCFVQNQ